MSLLRCQQLTVGYKDPILPPIDADLGVGEFWAVVGRNGSGKTTWFRTLLGMTRPLGGAIVAKPGLRLAYVPQRTGFDDRWPLRVRQVVAMGVDRGWDFLHFKSDTHDLVMDALGAVGATEVADKPYAELSEGWKQRVLLARMVASKADLALLDEPTAAMDVVAERESLALLDEVRRTRNITVVVVSHFLGVARDMADRVLFLDRDHQTALAGTAAEVFAHPAFLARYGETERP